MTCVEREIVDAVEWAHSSRVRREGTKSKSKVLGWDKGSKGLPENGRFQLGVRV